MYVTPIATAHKEPEEMGSSAVRDREIFHHGLFKLKYNQCLCVCARAHVRVDKNICIHREKRLERYHAIVTNAHNLEER